jgi:hypothetical protein
MNNEQLHLEIDELIERFTTVYQDHTLDVVFNAHLKSAYMLLINIETIEDLNETVEQMTSVLGSVYKAMKERIGAKEKLH